MKRIWETAGELQAQGKPFVVVTMIGVRGSAPQDMGAKAIVTSDGLHWGTVGGGKIEARCIQRSLEILADTSRAKDPELVTWNLQRDIGMSCGGEATYLFETHRTDLWKIALFGAGHVAQAVMKTLSTLECQVTCIDSRQEWIEKVPPGLNVKKVLMENPPDYVAELDPNTFFLVMTRGHATDVPVLEAILKKFPEPVYLGAIGSDVKALKIRAELKEKGYSAQQITGLRCPVGLPIGGNTPNEIAISIAAELLQVRDQRSIAR